MGEKARQKAMTKAWEKGKSKALVKGKLKVAPGGRATHNQKKMETEWEGARVVGRHTTKRPVAGLSRPLAETTAPTTMEWSKFQQCLPGREYSHE